MFFWNSLAFSKAFDCVNHNKLWRILQEMGIPDHLICLLRNGTPLQYPCLENPMGGGAWWAAVHGVAKSRTWLSDWTELNWLTAYKLNKQGDNIQTWYTPFPIWNQSVVLCPVLTIASWSAYRFLKRQVRWSGILTSWRIFHCLLWSTQSKALA